MRKSFGSGGGDGDEQEQQYSDDDDDADEDDASIAPLLRNQRIFLSAEQEMALRKIWNDPKCSILAILPVGGGKTALFTEPAKQNLDGALSLMISPFRPLLVNQMNRAKEEGLQCLHFPPGTSHRSTVEIDHIWNAARGVPIPYAKALYVTPEQLERGSIFSLLLIALARHNKIRMIFVDEAHELIPGVANNSEVVPSAEMIGPDSQPWRRGAAIAVQNFIHDIRNASGNSGSVQVVFATATATQKEQGILASQFLDHGRPSEYPEPISIVTPAVFPTANLHFTTIFCSSNPSSHHSDDSTTTDQYYGAGGGRSNAACQTIPISNIDAVLAILVSHFNNKSSSSSQQSSNKGQILICVRKRDLTVQLARVLKQQYGNYIEEYNRQARYEEERHGGGGGSLQLNSSTSPTIGYWNSELSNAEVQRVISEWESGGLQVVVATPGFGTGIHNERTNKVIIVDPPLSATVLLQQIGRAGRSGNSGEAIVLVDSEFWKKYQQQSTRQQQQQQQRGDNDYRQKQGQVLELLYDQETCIKQSFAKIFGDSSTTELIASCLEDSTQHQCDRCDPSLQRQWRNKIIDESLEIQFYLRARKQHIEQQKQILAEQQELRSSWEMELGNAFNNLQRQQQQQQPDDFRERRRQQSEQRNQETQSSSSTPSRGRTTNRITAAEFQPQTDRELIQTCWSQYGLVNGEVDGWLFRLTEFHDILHGTIKGEWRKVINGTANDRIKIMVSILEKSFGMPARNDRQQQTGGTLQQRCNYCFAQFEPARQQTQNKHSTDDPRGCHYFDKIPSNQGVCYKCDFQIDIGSKRSQR